VNGESTRSGESFSSDDKASPADPYAISKWEAEVALKQLARDTGMVAVIVRPPLVYGPGVSGNFASLMRWIDRGVPLPFGAIDNRRSLVAIPVWMLTMVTSLLGKRGLAQRLCGSLQINLAKEPRLLGWKPLVSVNQAMFDAVNKSREQR
jgi:hypothetical protein